MTEEFSDITNWVAHVGVWDFSRGHCVYKSPQDPQWPYGICVSNVRFSEGTARATICFSEVDNAVETSGRLLFGWRSLREPYLTVGLGGHGCEFCVYRYDLSGWTPVALAGSRKNLIANHPYKLTVRVRDQRILLDVDSVQVLEYVLEAPLSLEQFGLFTWGTTSVEFTNISVSQRPGSAATAAKLTDAVILRPSWWGMGIDLPKVWEWLQERLHPVGREQQATPQFPKTALNRVWRDPVWSKVIPTGIIAGIGALLVWYLHTQNPPPPARTPAPAITAPPPAAASKSIAQSTPSTASGQSSNKPSAPPSLTLEYFFEHDSPLGSYERKYDDLGIKDPTTNLDTTVTLRVRLYYDFTSHSEFLSVYIPQFKDARLKPNDFITILRDRLIKEREEMQTAIVIGQAQPGISYSESTELNFSGRVFIYTTNPLSAVEMGDLVRWYQQSGLYLEIRGMDYLTFKRLAK